MRLWTLHPKYLDSKGIVACWREALLARAVLAGHTRGYTHHPQLIRFREQPKPLDAIASFLTELEREARKRGYHFDASKIPRRRFVGQIDEAEGQLLFEWKHLMKKLKLRAPLLHRRFRNVDRPEPHPLFRIVPGSVREWEKG